MKKAFTLIELLVVVLIIGILSAIALPQYQVAVKKSSLTKYMAVVRAMRDAEEAYYLANGSYTTDLMALDIGLPVSGCDYLHSVSSGYYQCGENPFVRYGVWGPDNAQAGDESMRYVMFFQDATKQNTDFKKGDIVCYSKGELADWACRSLGPGTQYPATGSGEWTYYLLAQ